MPAVYGVYVDWNGDGDFSDHREDITARVLDKRTPIVVQCGRDQLRTLAPIAPGRAALEITNASRDYSPENASSPLAGSILPGRGLKITATLSGSTTVLMWGHLDDYDVLPDTNTRSVQMTGLDMLAQFKTSVSVDLHFSITTGQAINLVLDAIGWPASARDIDAGATVIRWYWEESSDGLTALQQLVNSEGPGALVYVDYSTGNFVFRDRHHRLIRTASKTSQATFRDKSGPEPVLARPLVYDHGWKEIVNSVSFSVEERDPAPDLEDVFSSDRTYSIANGETLAVHAQASDPFFGAIMPEAGVDYMLASGTVTITMSRTAGQSTVLLITATGGPALIQGLKIRAYPVRVTRTIRVSAEESTSIQKYKRRSYQGEAPWAGVNDAQAIAEMILAQRAEKLPVVRIRLNGANDTRLAHQLARRLSDRITIIDTEMGLNGDFYIERIEHRIHEGGLYLETVFGCEKVPTQPSNIFRFDVAGAGFNDGVFGTIGLDDPTKIFLFDQAGRGFNDGVFAH